MTDPTALTESLPELKTRIHKPLNVEASFLNPPSPITTAEHFFIRGHFPLPTIDASSWRLEVSGAVEKPLSLSLADLKAMPTATHKCVLECAGNGRLFLPNVPEGVQWGLGAAGCAAWTGVPLRDVLTLAGLKSDALELVFEGADHGIPEKQLKPKNEIHYSRSVPLTSAMKPEVLLAWQMNGENLSEAHGAPLRLVVPDWYSVASVKWLTTISVVSRPFLGYFQTVEYAYWAHQGSLPPERIPITEIFLKSQIAHPVMHQQLRAGEVCRVYGATWGAETPVDAVEVSTDKGLTWHPAEFDSPAEDHAWRLWHWEWKPGTIGNYILMSRASDREGRTQPAQHNEDHESYLIHHTLPIPVEVV
jgi:DMSO/TMAO reductase YedYZ molybdopterin-dependent catalytic subunit